MQIDPASESSEVGNNARETAPETSEKTILAARSNVVPQLRLVRSNAVAAFNDTSLVTTSAESRVMALSGACISKYYLAAMVR